MTHFAPIPATSLAATYHVRTRTLTLYASGVVQKFTHDIRFTRVVLLGGMRFKLEGWTLAVQGKQPYKARQSFHVADIHVAVPGGKVVVVTANHPKGVLVPIHILGLDKDGSAKAAGDTAAVLADHGVKADEAAVADASADDDAAAAAAHATDATAAALVAKLPPPQPIKIVTHVRQHFRITEPLIGPSGSGVTLQTYIKIDFDKRVLALVNAGVVGGQLVWTLSAAAVGRTQVIVEHRYASGHLVLRKLYAVSVLPPWRHLAASSGGALALTAAGVDAKAIAEHADDDGDDEHADEDDVHDEESEAAVTFDDDDDDAADDAIADDAADDDAAAAAVVTGRRLPVPLPYLYSLRLGLKVIEKAQRGSGAQLVGATAKLPLTGKPVYNVIFLQSLSALANFTDASGRQKSGWAISSSWGHWTQTGAHDVIKGLQTIDLNPARKPLGIFAAQRALRKAGHRNAFWSVELIWPQTQQKGGEGGGDGKITVAPADEPHYLFTLDNNLVVNVGFYSGKVGKPHVKASVHLLPESA